MEALRCRVMREKQLNIRLSPEESERLEPWRSTKPERGGSPADAGQAEHDSLFGIEKKKPGNSHIAEPARGSGARTPSHQRNRPNGNQRNRIRDDCETQDERCERLDREKDALRTSAAGDSLRARLLAHWQQPACRPRESRRGEPRERAVSLRRCDHEGRGSDGVQGTDYVCSTSRSKTTSARARRRPCFALVCTARARARACPKSATCR